MVTAPPACSTDADCTYQEFCDLTGIPVCVPDAVLEYTFDDGLIHLWWTNGGVQPIPLRLPHPTGGNTGGNPDGFIEYDFPSVPFRWSFRYVNDHLGPLSAPFSFATVDFSFDVQVIEAGVGVTGGWVAPVIYDLVIQREYVGPFVPVRDDTTTSGWQTISSSGLTANDFCRLNAITFDRDCSDSSDQPGFNCPITDPATAAASCVEGGVFLKSDEFSSEPVRLGFDNWRLTFNQ
jgi:hypothetical protein